MTEAIATAASAAPAAEVDTTRELVRRTSLELFSRLGFNATGMRLIAQEAGVSIATVYHYISSKDDLLHDLLRENLSTLFAEASRALQGRRSARDKLRALVDVHVTIHATERELCQVSDRELRSLPEAAQRDVIELRDTYEALWRSALVQGQNERAFTFEDLSITSHALLEMCTGVVHWFQPEGRLSVQEVVKLHQDLALRLLGLDSKAAA